MDNAVKVIIAIVAIAVLTVSVMNAYGEEQIYYEPKFKFPIPAADNIEEMVNMCGLKSISDIAMHIQCDFVIMFSDDGMSWYIELVEKTGLTDGKPQPEEPQDTPIDSNFVPDKQPQIDKEYQKDKEEFEDKPAVLSSEKDYSAMLDELSTCMRGINESKGVATTEQFTVSNSALDEEYLQSFELTGSHRTLALAIQECQAIRTILNPVTLGIETLHKGQYFGQVVIPHNERAIVDEEYWNIIPTQESEVLTPHDFIEEAETAFDNMCNSNIVLPNYKEQQGCSEKQTAIQCIAIECKQEMNNTGIGEMPIGTAANKIDRTPLDKLDQYDVDGGESMAKDLRKQIIEDHRQELNP